jgi:hypothetical protein
VHPHAQWTIGQSAIGQPWSRLFARTTGDGVTMRVFLDPNAAPAVVEAELSTNDAVASVEQAPSQPPQGAAIGSIAGGVFGGSEGAIGRWVIVNVAPNVARVRATFGNGSDEMQPVQGVAVLAHLGSGAVVISALDSQGKTLVTTTFTTDSCGDACSPTPTTIAPPDARTLPAPGAEQPADTAAARQGVSQSVAAAFEGAKPDQAMANAIEGGSALVSVFDELRTGSFARQVTEAKTVIDGIVFRSAANAAVEFHSDLGPDGTSGPYFADAALTGSGWQVTHDSYCRIIKAAAAHCP